MELEELELLRQRITFLEEALGLCQERIASLESRVAVLEGRPVAVGPTHEDVRMMVQRISDEAGGRILPE